MALNDRYRVDVIDGLVTTTYPLYNDRLRLQHSRGSNRRFYRKEIKTALRFMGAAFTFFESKIADGNCISLPVKIYKNCDATTFDLWYEGQIKLASAKFDYSRGICELNVEPDDLYTCIERNLKKKFNLLEYGDAFTAYNVMGTFETVYCSQLISNVALPAGLYTPSDCIPGGAAAAQFIVTNNFQVFKDGAVPGEVDVEISTEWTREVVFSATSPHPSFTLISAGKWARPANIIPGKWETVPHSGTAIEVWEYKARLLDYGIDLGLDNGRLLQQVLPLIVTDLGCGLNTASNFFNINPSGPSPSNIAYTRAAQRCQRIFMYERTDVTNWNADNNATKLEVTFEDLIDYLKKQFNLDWTIVEISGTPTFRLEHVSYFEKSQQFDFTTPDYSRFTRGNKIIEFVAQDDIPFAEQFSFGDSKTLYFTPTDIVYTGCETSPNKKEIGIAFVSNDLVWLTGGSESKDGMSFVSVFTWAETGKDYMHVDHGVTNGAFSWKDLLENYHLHERLSSDFEILGVAKTALSVIRQRRQKTISFPIPCATEETFDPARLQRTAIGWGEVDTAEYDTLTGVLSLQMLH